MIGIEIDGVDTSGAFKCVGEDIVSGAGDGENYVGGINF